MNRALHSVCPSPPDRAWTAAQAAPDDRPDRPRRWVWAWLRSCGGFARSAPGSQGVRDRAFSSEVDPVRVKKMRQNEESRARFDSIETEKALAPAGRLDRL